MNDKVKSIDVSPNYEVTVYMDVNYGGAYFTVSQDMPTLNIGLVNFNDKISSIKVKRKD